MSEVPLYRKLHTVGCVDYSMQIQVLELEKQLVDRQACIPKLETPKPKL